MEGGRARRDQRGVEGREDDGPLYMSREGSQSTSSGRANCKLPSRQDPPAPGRHHRMVARTRGQVGGAPDLGVLAPREVEGEHRQRARVLLRQRQLSRRRWRRRQQAREAEASDTAARAFLDMNLYSQHTTSPASSHLHSTAQHSPPHTHLVPQVARPGRLCLMQQRQHRLAVAVQERSGAHLQQQQ